MKKVVIIIPTYKKTLSTSEQYALKRCRTLLSAFDIVFVAPEKLDIDYCAQNIIHRFPDKYFVDIQGYNALMLSAEFYQRFLDLGYEFMLIHQLDALVIKNELLYWCGKNYDYIGASWIDKKRNFLSRCRRIFDAWRWKSFCKGKKIALKKIKLDYLTYKEVGNGGFSLRKIAKLLALVITHQDWIAKILTHTTIPEDIFFGVLLNLYKKNEILVAPFAEGIKFAFEMRPEISYKQNNYELPFGGHDIDDWSPEFWKKIKKIAP